MQMFGGPHECGRDLSLNPTGAGHSFFCFSSAVDEKKEMVFGFSLAFAKRGRKKVQEETLSKQDKITKVSPSTEEGLS